MLKTVALFKMAEQMLPWQLRTFGKYLLMGGALVTKRIMSYCQRRAM